MIRPKQLRYGSYLLRYWAEMDAGGEVILWRFSLQNPQTGQRRGFASLTELVIALQDELMEAKQDVAARSVHKPAARGQ
jgi:hypothetical protein